MSPNQHIVGGTFCAIIGEEIFAKKIESFQVYKGLIIIKLSNCDDERSQWTIGFDEIEQCSCLSCEKILLTMKRDDPTVEPEQEWIISFAKDTIVPIRNVKAFLTAT